MDNETKDAVMKYPMMTGYEEMHEELPENDLERETLKILRDGGSLLECREIWKGKGYHDEEFDTFLRKARRWENEHLCGS